MAITYSSPNIIVTGGITGGNVSSGTLTTLIDSTQSWTTNVYANRLVWIRGGTRADAVGYVTSNNATSLVCTDGFQRFNPTTKVYESVSPTTGDVFHVCYTMADIITAQPSYASWTITNKEAAITAGISLSSNGALQCIEEVWRFTNGRQTIQSSTGTFFQAGLLQTMTFPYDGQRGGIITGRLSATGVYWIPSMLGKMKFFGSMLYYDREEADATNAFTTINSGLYTGDGIEFLHSTIGHASFDFGTGKDVCVLSTGIGKVTAISSTASFALNAQPYLFQGNRIPIGLRPYYGSELGIRGCDIIDHTNTNAGTFDFFLYKYSLVYKGVSYLWNTLITSAWTSLARWYQNEGDGYVYRGYIVTLDVRDTSSNLLSDVKVYVAKTSTGAGAILTAKAANYTPTLSTSVNTTSGVYTGIVGVNEGMPVLYARYSRTSEYVSAETLYGPYTFKLRKYGYMFQSLPKNWTSRSTEAITLNANQYVVADSTNAAAYSTLATIDYANATATITNVASLQQIYDYTQYAYSTNTGIAYNELISCSSPGLFSGNAASLILNANVSGNTITDTSIIYNGGFITSTMDNCRLKFNSATTYDLRANTFTGTTSLTNQSAGNVAVKLPLSTVYNNIGPNITVELSQSVTVSAPNLIAGTRVQLYDVTGAVELDNTVLVANSYSKTLTIPNDVADGSTLRLRAVWVDGLSAKMDIESYGVISTTGLTFIDTQTESAIYDGNNIDGSSVTEFSADYPNVQIDIDDPDYETTVQRIFNWYRYLESTEDGIRYFYGGLTADDSINYRIESNIVDLYLDNVGSPATIFGGRLYRDDGVSVIYTGSNALFMDPGKAYIATPDYQYMADTTMATNIDDGVTLKTGVAAILSTVAGVASGGNTANITFRNANNTSDRVTMVVDANGNRSSVDIIPD